MPNATSRSAPPALEIRRTFNATQHRVFDAWASAEALKRWHAPADAVVEYASVDFRVGGRYAVHMRGVDGSLHVLGGEYREIVRPSRIVLTWRWEAYNPDEESIVTVEIIPRGNTTELVLTHSGFASEQSRAGHGIGWASSLDKLEASVAA